MATTIYTYLHNDDLSGSRIVSMDDCMCKLYNIKFHLSRCQLGFQKENILFGFAVIADAC